MFSQIACIWRCIVTLDAFVRFFSTVHIQMCPQTACPWGCIVTLVTFVRFFFAVCSQMLPQIACTRECKVTLVTFVWLFSSVRFQMSPQRACTRGCIVTLVALLWPHNSCCRSHKSFYIVIGFYQFILIHNKEVGKAGLTRVLLLSPGHWLFWTWIKNWTKKWKFYFQSFYIGWSIMHL